MSMSGHNRNGYHNTMPTTSHAAMAMSMITKCSLDSDQCCNLLQILDSFHTAINEEQAWSICYQCVVSFNQHYHPCQSYLITDPQHIVIHKDGYVHQKTLQLCSSDDTTRPLATSHNQLIKSLGVVLFHALDYGLCEDEERTLSKPLENLIEKLTSVGHRKRPTRNDNSSDGHSDDDYDDNDDDFAKDEGIERDCHDDCDQSLTHHTITFDQIIQMCISRLSCRESAESHYKAVCRALVAEALELSTFLDQIAKGTKELRKSSVVVIGSSHTNELDANLDGLQFHDWARLWIQVICELRHGVKLKKVDHDSLHHLEFELTPYEMLLDDIRSRRYKLNKVMLNGDLPPRVKKDAHALILDFIRSRPPLVPVSKRVLAPPPPKQVTLYDKLMQSIRQQHKLRPTPPCHSAHVTPTHTPNNTITVETSRTKLTDTEMTPAPRRRLIKADLTLHLSNSFDDDDEDNNRNLTLQWSSLPKSTSLADDDNVFSEPQEKQISLPCQDNRVEQQQQEEEEEKKSRRFSLKNLSLRLLSHERRHSITVCESPSNRKSDEISDLDVNEDTRQHVASIWESTDWGRALECLSLTLQEVQHIRSVLTKAEIETLAVTKSLRDDLENGKICFTCLKTRFSFWGPRPTLCKLCERAICERCSTKMHIPTEHFDKVPIYMLSPTPSPPADGDDKTKWLQTTTPVQHVCEEETRSLPQMDVSLKKKSRLMRVFTRDKDIVLYDSSNKKSMSGSNGPLVRVCRDCKILVRHLIDIGHTNFDSSKCVTNTT